MWFSIVFCMFTRGYTGIKSPNWSNLCHSNGEEMESKIHGEIVFSGGRGWVKTHRWHRVILLHHVPGQQMSRMPWVDSGSYDFVVSARNQLVYIYIYICFIFTIIVYIINYIYIHVLSCIYIYTYMFNYYYYIVISLL